MSSIQEYWDSLPKLTRGYMGIILATTGLTSFGMISPYKIVLIWQAVFSKFEIWRIVTNFFYLGKPSFQLLMQLMLIGRFGSSYENDPFRTGQSTTGDFLFSVGFIGIILVGLGYFFEIPILGQSLIFAIVYLWSRRNPTSPVSVWGFRLTGSNLPWVFIGLGVLLGNNPIPDLMGLAAAHLFYFCVEVLPIKTGTDYLTTPTFVQSLANYITGDNHRYVPAVPTSTSTNTTPNPWSQPQQQQQPQSSGHSWGTGQRLGS